MPLVVKNNVRSFVHQQPKKNVCIWIYVDTYTHKKTNWNCPLPPSKKLFQSCSLIAKKLFSFFHSIRRATSRLMEAVIWSSVKKHQLLVTKVAKRRQPRIQLNNRHLESMEAFRSRRVRFRKRRHRPIGICIFHHRPNLAHATRRTRRKRTSCTWKSIS